MTGYYTSRHLRSEFHRNCLARVQAKSKFDKRQKILPSTPDFPSEKTPKKTYERYRIEGDTLKKCPHEHKSIFDTCDYFDDRKYSQQDDSEHDDRWHVKQTLFEKEQQHQLLYPDMPQPSMDYTEMEALDDYHNDADNTNSQPLFTEDLMLHETTDQNIECESGIHIPSSQHHQNCEQSALKPELSCDSGSSDGEDAAGLFKCGVFHHNPFGFYACEICNDDKKTLEEYKQYVN